MKVRQFTLSRSFHLFHSDAYQVSIPWLLPELSHQKERMVNMTIFMFLFITNTKLKSFSILFVPQGSTVFSVILHLLVTSMILQLFSESVLVSESLKIRLWQGREPFFLIVLCITVTIKLLFVYFYFLSLLLASPPSFIFQRLSKFQTSSFVQFNNFSFTPLNF